MKNIKDKIIFIGVIILGFILRILFIDKSSGFWHNEMVMYNQAIAGFPLGIIKAAVEYDVHFPLYQLCLALWIKVFSNNDIVIRMFSVLIGTLTIFFAFLTGKELKDEKLGNIFAFLTAINATLVFYSQEVKFYIMLAMFSSMTLLFLMKIKNKNNITSHIGYILTNTAIIYTFTIGIFYVFAQFIAFLLYIFIKNKNILKKFLISNFILLLFILPFAYYIITNFDKYEAASWIFTSNIFTLFVLIQNYFSPAIIAVYNNPIIYVPTFSLMPIIFIYIPVSVSFYGIFKAIKENKNNLFILSIPLIFLFCEIILCLNSGLRMLTRYTILAIIPLLLLVAIGFRSLKPKLLKIIITYLFIINIFFLIAVPTSAVRGYRDLGQKPTANLLMQNNIQDEDAIILALRKNDFDKYLIFKGQKYSLLQDFIYKEYFFDKTKMPDKYAAFEDYIFNKSQINEDYEKYFLKTVIDPITKGHKLFFIWDDNYNSYPFSKKSHYKKYPIMTLSLSKINAETFKICDKYLKYQKGFQLSHYKVFVFKK